MGDREPQWNEGVRKPRGHSKPKLCSSVLCNQLFELDRALINIGVMNKCVTLAKLTLTHPLPSPASLVKEAGERLSQRVMHPQVSFPKALGFPRCRQALCPIFMLCH